MGRVKIGVISPYAGFTEIVLQSARDLNLDVAIREEALDRAAGIARQWEKEGEIEIIIARGATGLALKRELALPVVIIEITSFDIAEALSRARHKGKDIVLVDFAHRPPKFDYEKISGIVGIDFKTYLYSCEKELDNIMEELSGQRPDVVVGVGLQAVQRAQAQGLETVLVHSSLEFIQDAIKKAWDICGVRRRDLRMCRSFQAILNNAYDGIMAVEKGEITIFNPVAEKTTGFKASEALGKSIEEVCRINATCRMLYGDGRPAGGQLLYLGDLPLVVNRLPAALGHSTALIVTFQAADKIKRMEAKIRRELHSQGLVARFRFSDIVGSSAMITETIQEARKYARSGAAVLISGESGTGKELFAQSLHNESSRRDGPFVAVNCAALPENLLESELFGYEEGAFTGARRGGKQGLFSLAHGGTIFLDEVGELSPALQARLLRVLQQKEVMPVGGQRVLPVDIRVVSATNQNLTRAVVQGRFRKDLFFRLNVLNLQVPPLRDRLEDVPMLFNFFLDRLAGPGGGDSMGIDAVLPETLKKYMWPGNVRELEGFIERYVALGEDDISRHTTFYMLFSKLVSSWDDPYMPGEGSRLTIEMGNMTDMERQILAHASRLIRGNKGEMAKLLGISRTTLWKKLKELDLDAEGDEKVLK